MRIFHSFIWSILWADFDNAKYTIERDSIDRRARDSMVDTWNIYVIQTVHTQYIFIASSHFVRCQSGVLFFPHSHVHWRRTVYISRIHLVHSRSIELIRRWGNAIVIRIECSCATQQEEFIRLRLSKSSNTEFETNTEFRRKSQSIKRWFRRKSRSVYLERTYRYCLILIAFGIAWCLLEIQCSLPLRGPSSKPFTRSLLSRPLS